MIGIVALTITYLATIFVVVCFFVEHWWACIYFMSFSVVVQFPCSSLCNPVMLTLASHRPIDHVRYNGHFSCLVFFFQLFWKRTFRVSSNRFLVSFLSPTNTVRALRKTQSTDCNQWSGLIFFLLTTRLLMGGAL